MQSLMENLWIFLFYMAVNHAAFYGCQGKKTPKCYEGDKSSNLNSAFQKASWEIPSKEVYCDVPLTSH